MSHQDIIGVLTLISELDEVSFVDRDVCRHVRVEAIDPSIGIEVRLEEISHHVVVKCIRSTHRETRLSTPCPLTRIVPSSVEFR